MQHLSLYPQITFILPDALMKDRSVIKTNTLKSAQIQRRSDKGMINKTIHNTTASNVPPNPNNLLCLNFSIAPNPNNTTQWGRAAFLKKYDLSFIILQN